MKEIQILRAKFQAGHRGLDLSEYRNMLDEVERECKRMNIDKSLIFMCDIGFNAIASRNKINEFQYDNRTLKTPI